MGLTLLAQSHLPPSFWVDAFLTSIFIINRLPAPILDHDTPFTKLFGSSPDYTFLRTFGCACFPLFRPHTSHKLMFHSKQGIFLGYSSLRKGYRCLDPLTHKVYISRHVTFDEKSFHAKEGALSPAPSSSTPVAPLPHFTFSEIPYPLAAPLPSPNETIVALMPFTNEPQPTTRIPTVASLSLTCFSTLHTK